MLSTNPDTYMRILNMFYILYYIIFIILVKNHGESIFYGCFRSCINIYNLLAILILPDLNVIRSKLKTKNGPLS